MGVGLKTNNLIPRQGSNTSVTFLAQQRMIDALANWGYRKSNKLGTELQEGQ